MKSYATLSQSAYVLTRLPVKSVWDCALLRVAASRDSLFWADPEIATDGHPSTYQERNGHADEIVPPEISHSPHDHKCKSTDYPYEKSVPRKRH
jgi:hypothetical protein